MHTPQHGPLFVHRGIALLRAAAMPLLSPPPSVPDFADVDSCRSWLAEVWSLPGFALAVDQASGGLSAQVVAALEGRLAAVKVRRVTESVSRYLLRASGRPTPFGLFAGVAPVTVEPEAHAQWGTRHRPVARVDTLWLGEVLDRLEVEPLLLRSLDVISNNLALVRGSHLEVPSGPNRVRVAYTPAVRAVYEATTGPVGFAALADKLADTFGAPDTAKVQQFLAGLVQQRVLITSLRAPTTVTDPLGYALRQLHAIGAFALPPVASLCDDLTAIRDGLRDHNDAGAGAEQAVLREAITVRMREVSPAGRTALAVDLRLDCAVTVPAEVLSEVASAADVLMRLTRRPTGGPAWRAYHVAFRDRYGIGTLVSLTDAVDPDTGLGYPPGYPGTSTPTPPEPVTRRDEVLLALAWRAVNDGSREVALTDDTIALLTDERFDAWDIPAHVEVAARVHAPDTEAIGRGEYTLTVAPARACGTLTSRFTELATGSGLERVFADLPTGTRDALRVQLSVPPVYPHAENVGRVPAYLPHVLSLGEYPSGEGITPICLDDLALTATRDRLHLISLSRRRPVEVQVFHALALEKQLPALARFLAHLPRAFSARWHEFDWGPHAHRMPYLPRLRHGRAVIAPARWRLTSQDLPPTDSDDTMWRTAFTQWCIAWRCPDTVELRAADRTLRLETTAPAHLSLLRAHLDREGDATLVETASAADYGWIGGHVHEIAVPLTATAPLSLSVRVSTDPPLSNARHGHMPGSPDGRWLSAKLSTHPERHDEILTVHLPRLLDSLDGDTGWYFLRYRSTQETDHLRLRLRINDPEQYGRVAARVGAWARQLRAHGEAGNLILDTYYPEAGRYGHGHALDAAEDVFAADSRAVLAALHHLHRLDVDPVAFAALNMVDIAQAFTGTTDGAIRWLIDRDCPPGPRLDRDVLKQALRLARTGDPCGSAGWPDDIGHAWRSRSHTLRTYRRSLASDANHTAILESLLHMHHNRALGIDPDREAGCRRLARQAALAMQAQHTGADR